MKKKDNIEWSKTLDGRKTASTVGNTVNLCKYCLDDFPTCPAINVVFGDGLGNDNVSMCSSYRHSEKPRGGINKLSATEVLQKIYDSEIHLSIGWMWDGGIDYTIGKDLNYLSDSQVKSTGSGSIDDAVNTIADDVAKEYPDSVFAKWWSSKDDN
jgi:hypothetical protein